MSVLLTAVGFGSTLLLSTSNTLFSAALAKKGMRFRGDPSTSILVIEMVKFVCALIWHLTTRKGPVRPSGMFLLKSVRYAIPALLYLVMNTTIVMMVADFGGLNTVLLLNLKIPATGLLAWGIMGRRLSMGQFFALVLLCVGASMSQLPDSRAALSALHLDSRGLIFGLGYAFLSALSGVFTEMLLRGGKDESLALQQVQLYWWGMLANISVVWFRGYQPPLDWTHPIVLGMISAQVLSGLLTAWLLRTQGSYARVFLHSMVGVCVALFGFAVWGDAVSHMQMWAIGIIAVAIYCFRHFEPLKPLHLDRDYLHNLDIEKEK